MTIRYSRFDRVTAALTAKERGLLVLRSWKEGKEEDPRWRWTMPPEQVPEFNRLIGLMNGVNRGIGIYLLDLKAKVRELRLCAAWLATAVLWQCQVLELGSFIVGCTKELITESDYREKEREARAEHLPVAQLAYELTERHDGFAEEDLDPESAHDDAMVRPEAWERVQAKKAKEIARLVASGMIRGRGRGKSLRVEAGSFYDWLAKPVPVGPAWAAAYEVVPDGEAERAAQHRFLREEAHRAYRKGPTRLVLHLPGVTDGLQPESASEIDELVAAHKETFKEGVVAVWQQVEAVERVVAEVAREFDGEDPALPPVRHVLDHCREELRELHEDAGRYSGPFEVGEPDEELLDKVRALVSEEGT